MKFIINESQYKLFLKENYDPNKEFLEGREARVIVSIPNKNNPKDPNSCKVLRYATPSDQKIRMLGNTSNYEKSEEYTIFCYTKGDLANKMKIFDQSDGKQQISRQDQEEKQFEENRKKTEQNAFNLLRDFTTQMAQKLNGGGYSSTEYCKSACYVSKTGQFYKFFDELKEYQIPGNETGPQYVPQEIIKKYACINKNVLSGYQDFKKYCDSNVLPILSKEFNCSSIDDCTKKMDFYLKNFYIQKEKNLSELIVEYRHGILTTLSIVSSLIPLAGPLLALIFDLADAYIYYKEEEYYSAGLNLIFAVIPVGQLASYGITKTTTLVKGIQEASVLAKEGKLTEKELSKIFTQQDLESLKSLSKQSPELISKMFKETAEKMIVQLFEKVPTEKILLTLKDKIVSDPLMDLVGQGIIFGGAFFAWDKISEKYQIADLKTKKEIEKETQFQITQNITKNIVKEKSSEKQIEAVQKLKEFTKDLEKIKEDSKKVVMVTFDNGESVNANDIPW